MTKPYLTMLEKPETTNKIPIWMMRQAGRYLPEYRTIREKHSFLEMVYTPDIATEITLQPIKRFGFDAAILFSDILVVPQALGLDLNFLSGQGPVFSTPIRSKNDVTALKHNPNILSPIYDTIRQTKQQLTETSLIGFAGAPFTVASYMIEGASSTDLINTKSMMYSNPELFKSLLDKVTDMTIHYCEAQCHAGADALQLFDTWINHLDWDSCHKYSAQYVEKIVSELRHRGIKQPITFFGKQTSTFYPLYENTGIDVISFDWNANLSTIDKHLDKALGIQGNLDPMILFSQQGVIEKKVLSICQSVTSNRPFVFNLGHGLTPKTPIAAVETVVNTVKKFTN